MTLLAVTARNDETSPDESGSLQLSPQPRVTNGADAVPRTLQDTPLPSIEAIEEASASPLTNMAGLLDAIDGAEAEPAVAPETPRPTDRAASLAPMTPTPLRGRSPSLQPPANPHRVEEEEAPADPFNAQSFQSSLAEAKDAMAELVDVLSSSYLGQAEGSKLRELRCQAEVLKSFQHPTKRTVGFVGSSGAGKSSLLNCLLDRKDLSRSSNSGEACTCVATEFHYHEDTNCSIQAEFWTDKELRSQLQDLLQSYRHYVLHIDELEPGDRDDCEERYLLAMNTFESMFRGRLNDWDYLTAAPEAEVLDTFRGWISELDPRQLSDGDNNLSLAACSNRLACLASDTASADTAPMWPYLRKIKVFVNAHILSKGLVLADLPGLGDLNTARRNVTERFLRECDEIFVVCNIGRAATDESVDDVFLLAQQAMLTKVGIICTRSDDIDPAEARRDWPQHAQTIDRLQYNIDAKREELDELQNGTTDDEADPIERSSFRRNLRTTKRELAEREFELEEFLVTTRNDIVTDKLRDTYGDSIAQTTLEIHCVSKLIYWKTRNKDRTVYDSSLNLSGIRLLRRYCISIISESQHQAASRYMLHDIPALVAKVELWAQSGSITLDSERKQTIARVCNELEDRLATDLPGPSWHHLSRSLQRQFDESIYLSQRAPAWTQEAKNAASEWNGWYHPTYSAFCRQYGHYKTDAVGAHNWNEEIIQAMVDELAEPWDGLRISSINERDAICSIVDAQVDDKIEYLKDELGPHAREVRLLRRVLHSESNIFLNKIAQVFSIFEADALNLRVDMLSSIRTSFVGVAMEGAYRNTQNESGRGSDGRRKAIIGGAVADQRLFLGILHPAKTKFAIIADNLSKLTLELLDSYLAKISSTLDIIRNENVVQESETDPVFRCRVEEVVGRVNDVMSNIEAQIDS